MIFPAQMTTTARSCLDQAQDLAKTALALFPKKSLDTPNPCQTVMWIFWAQTIKVQMDVLELLCSQHKCSQHDVYGVNSYIIWADSSLANPQKPVLTSAIVDSMPLHVGLLMTSVLSEAWDVLDTPADSTSCANV